VEQFNHQVDVVYDVLKEECSTMLSDFFRQLREWKKQQKIQQNKEDMTT
jgi:tRNA(adenine34) deaminase